MGGQNQVDICPMLLKTFGKLPSGERLARVNQSPNYKNGSFQNLSPTEVTLKGVGMGTMLKEFFNKPKTTVPPFLLPFIKTDLQNLLADTPTIVWFGHSSYLIKSKGVSILVDPVFSGNASPFKTFVKSFPGTNTYSVDDFGSIDILVITHDHYDHLDYNTIKAIAPKVKQFITSLGVGAHLEHWGIPAAKITELDWWENTTPLDAVELTATPARHFSGRGLKRGQSLWSSFVLKIHGHNLYLGGDSGYDTHFTEIGNQFGPFDLAILEAGQYGTHWPYIHMLPEETLQAATELNAKTMLPVHWAKFALALHEWDNPIKRIIASQEKYAGTITTPKIGEPILLHTHYPTTKWWENIKNK